ncbi:lipase family protein [Rhodococcus erythropolis]|uniref:lipase family protein n=1 Tax=Rhodococcus erythropolis TaxID=1833 RepID=UPI002226B8F4|nr:lipase family protein [Rhodococcus erythropolis]MCW2295541.1 hypothetical protein [Rhodococcus erythropolis]
MYTDDPKLATREAPGLNVAIAKGWSVAIPNHLGPPRAYGAAKLGGQITLDGIRAAQRFDALDLDASPVGMAGYSGGAMATAIAAAIAPTYAPELQLAGSAYGGAPMNIDKMAKALGQQKHPAFGLAMAAALGLEREYPDRMPITSQLNSAGQQLRDQIANTAANETMFLRRRPIPRRCRGPAMSAWRCSTARTLRPCSPTTASKTFLRCPMPLCTSGIRRIDVLIPVEAIDSTMARYCEAGVPVTSDVVSAPDHLSAAGIGLPGALEFLDDRFAGIAPTTSC